MIRFLDISTIEKVKSHAHNGFILAVAPYHWGQTDEHQKCLQLELMKAYNSWFEHFCLLFHDVTPEIKRQIKNTNEYARSWIERNGSFSPSPTIQDSKIEFTRRIQTFYDLIHLLDGSNEDDLILIPDTNALIIAPDISKYSEFIGQTKYTIIIVPTVTRELDELKRNHRNIELKNKVDSVIKRLKGYRQQGNLLTGVTVNKTITIKMVPTEPKFNTTLQWLDPTNSDDRIIASVLELQRAYPSNKIVLVTNDLNLQNKAEMAKLPIVDPKIK